SLQADVDERGLHPGQDVVDLPLVDVADDRATAAALDVELGDLPLVARGRLLALLGGGPLRLEHRDSGLTPGDADQDVLLHDFPFFCAAHQAGCSWRSTHASHAYAAPSSVTASNRRVLVWVCSWWLSATVVLAPCCGS